MGQAAAIQDVGGFPVTTQKVTDVAPLTEMSRDEILQSSRAELLKRLDAYTPEKNIIGQPADRLNDRFVLHCDKPLPDLSYGNTRAFAATDEKGEFAGLFALVGSHGRPYRFRTHKALKGFEHSSLIKLIDSGTAKVSAFGESRFVLIYEQPTGKKLSQMLAEGARFNETTITETLLKPIYSVIASFEEMGIAHCRIYPDNIYVSNGKAILGDCIAEPASFSKPFYYEPIERMMSAPEGMGAATTKVDTYNLALLAIEATFGIERLKKHTKHSLIDAILSHGTYNTLMKGASFSEGFQDLLIGCFSDAPAERWGAQQLATWVKGKRFHLIQPSAPRDASRPFKFNGIDYYSAKGLANALYSHWETARNEVRAETLPRWVEQSMKNKEAAEILNRAIMTTGGINAKNQKFNDELLSRVITVLDPDGPLRLQNLSFHLDVLGLSMSEALKQGKHDHLSHITDLVDYDLPTFWADAHKGPVNADASETLWKLQKVRHYIKMPGLGFGMERFIYELNPHLPCLSAKVEKYHIVSLESMLYCLDNLARENARETSLIDRHIAAFIACHGGLARDVHFKELQHHPKLAKNPEIQMVVLLAKAQEKAKIKALRGLTGWVAMRLLGMLDAVYSYQARHDLARNIIDAADHGHIGLVLSALVYSKVLDRDAAGFASAIKLYQRNQRRMKELTDNKLLETGATRVGGQMAVTVALVILFGSICISLSKYSFSIPLPF